MTWKYEVILGEDKRWRVVNITHARTVALFATQSEAKSHLKMLRKLAQSKIIWTPKMKRGET